MAGTNKLLKSTLIYGIGGLGSKILSFMLLPLFTYYLSTEDLGIYDLILISINLIIPIVTLQISDATYRWLLDSQKDIQKQKIIISNSLIISLVFLFLFSLLYTIFTFFFEVKYSIYFLLILIPSSLFPLVQQIARGMGLNRLYAKAGVLNALFMLLFNLLFLVIFKMGVIGLFYALSLSYVFSLVYLFFQIRIDLFLDLKCFNATEIKKMILYSWPLIPNTISWWLINASNKYIILLFLSVEANGLYAISSRFPTIITIFNSIFMLSWQDYVIGEKKRESGAKIFNSFFIIELSFIIFLIAISPLIIPLLFDQKYAESWKYMPILYIASAFSAFSAFYGSYFLKEKNTKNIFYTTLIGGLINLVVSISFIGKLGLYAPALGTLLGFLVTYIIRSYIINKEFSMKIKHTQLIFCVLIAFLFFFLTLKGNMILNITLVCISICLMYILNRPFIKEVLLKFKK